MVDTSVIGKPVPPATITLERGPTSNFAKAIKDDNPIYQSPQAAKDAGFDNIPIPPTFGFAFAHWGAFPETQPKGHDAPHPLMASMGQLMASGGLILHGEQEFVYHAPVVVGDVLQATGKLTDAYEKQGGGGKTMTFVSAQTDYHNQRGELVLSQVMTLIHRS